MDLQGKVLGPYHIQQEIGRGGTAIVYRAIDLRHGQALALKILPTLIALDEMLLKRFIKEGKNLTRLRHENIVTTYEAGEIDGIYYIAMELITGGTLAELISRRPQLFALDESIHILSQIAAALDFAHSQGFLHRDVKPSNVLIAEDGRVLLTDFGTAKQIERESTLITATGQRIGTPSFMAPEQIAGEKTIDYRSDVYSLGVIAYKLFTGRLPFAANSQAELLHKIVYEQPVAPDTLNPELPAHVVNNLNRALAKDPALRHASAGQFVSAIVTGQIWATKLTAAPSALAAPEVVAAAKGQPLWANFRWPRRLLRPALAVLLLLGMWVAGSWVTRTGATTKLSAGQIQKVGIAQADYLSGILLNYFDSPQSRALWRDYGEPVASNLNFYTLEEHIQTIHHDLVDLHNPDSWLQRTWRKLTQLGSSGWF